MSTVLTLVLAILALAVLMIVHEGGHYLVARAFGMRVERFAIGIGPTIWRVQPKNSDTVFQVGLIPFLAYVQIAGMNPFEEIDPDDKGSYANGTLVARISAIIAGPLANYIFASIVFFAALLVLGKPVDGPGITVQQEMEQFSKEGKLVRENGDSGEVVMIPTPAASQGLKTGDKIVSIEGNKIEKWADIPKYIKPAPDEPLDMVILRDGKEQPMTITPGNVVGEGRLGVGPERIAYETKEAAIQAIRMPALIVAGTVGALGRMITGKEKAQLSGPLGLVRETKRAAKLGTGALLNMMAFISTSLAFFNMLPIPALDGGRLMFLSYEAVTRRRPNQKVEVQIHTVGMVMLLTTLVLVTYNEWNTDKTPSEEHAEQIAQERKAKLDAKKKAEKEKAASKKAGTESKNDSAEPPKKGTD